MLVEWDLLNIRVPRNSWSCPHATRILWGHRERKDEALGCHGVWFYTERDSRSHLKKVTFNKSLRDPVLLWEEHGRQREESVQRPWAGSTVLSCVRGTMRDHKVPVEHRARCMVRGYPRWEEKLLNVSEPWGYWGFCAQCQCRRSSLKSEEWE